MPSLPINTFEDQDQQKRADNARGMGYVVIKSVTNRDGMAFLSLLVIKIAHLPRLKVQW